MIKHGHQILTSAVSRLYTCTTASRAGVAEALLFRACQAASVASVKGHVLTTKGQLLLFFLYERLSADIKLTQTRNTETRRTTIKIG